MKNITIKNFSFSYGDSEKSVLKDISISINEGEFIIILGKSGSGKTTLLRHMKPSLAPYGRKMGEILLGNKDIFSVSKRDEAKNIGFIMQNPDNQIVADKVLNEISFTLENLGEDSSSIRRKTVETAEYFGLSGMLNKNVNELSDGQKQLLCLASVMASSPEILILDEPCSRLDPGSATKFFDELVRLNKDFGVMVIITEHNIDKIFEAADKIILMDDGKILFCKTPYDICNNDDYQKIDNIVPSYVSVYLNSPYKKSACPLNIKEGRLFLKNALNNPEYKNVNSDMIEKSEISLELSDISVKFSKDGGFVLNNLNASFNKGSVTSVLGGNGSGKTTLLKVIAKIIKPASGKVKIRDKNSKVGYLPAEPIYCFTEKTVKDDLKTISGDFTAIAEICEIKNILNSHPNDISGGELERAALAKVLLTNPNIILLDEPTKGLDVNFKEKFGEIIRKLSRAGKTIIIVTHDIEFSAVYSDYCMFLGNGKIVSKNERHDFFSSNNFYTTSARKLSKGIFDNAITTMEVIDLCEKNLKS